MNREERDTLSGDDEELLSDHHPNGRVKRQSLFTCSGYPLLNTVRRRRASSTSEVYCLFPNPLNISNPEIWIGVLGTAAVTTLAMNPAPGNVPSNAPQPGSPGGGALPSANPGNVIFYFI